MPQNSTKIYTQVSLPDRILQVFHLWTRVPGRTNSESEEFSFFPTTVQVNLHPFFSTLQTGFHTEEEKDTYSTKLTNTGENFKFTLYLKATKVLKI